MEEILVDIYGRHIDTLRISITDRCNLKCIYCSPENFQFLKKNEILSIEEIIEITKIFSKFGIRKIKITGGEPLLRKGFNFLIERLALIPLIEDISITTNGLLLSDYIQDLKRFNVRVNISLDTLKRERFKFITNYDGIKDVLNSIEKCIKNGIRIKINAVLLKSINDDEIPDFIKFGDYFDVTVRFIELMPTKNNHLNWEKHFLSEREIIERIKILGDILLIKKDRVSSPNTKYFKIDGFRGIYGIISPLSSPFCNMCNRIRLNAKGDLILCLGSEDSLNLKEILRKKELNIEKILKEFIFKKPKGHRLNLSNLPFIMCQIGG